jgi:SAM-dependent MidA family methyltransferase
MTPFEDAIATRIARHGPLRWSAFVDLALYDPTHGFYAAGGSAGRRGDFITSAEVGPLFGAVIGRALDEWWHELGRPDPFTVVEVGAGPGTLARALLAAAPACAAAWRLVLVERSDALRARHPVDERVESRGEPPTSPFIGVILANELLDNLAFDLWEHCGGSWQEVRIDVADDRSLREVRVPGDPALDAGWLAQVEGMVVHPVDGARVARHTGATAWLAAALGSVERGRVVLVDYTTTTAAMARRPWREWLRTYRGHERGGAPLDDPGTQDVTVEVAVDQLAAVRPPDVVRDQASFLVDHGLDDLVAEGRRIWAERAGVADLAALVARSRVREAEALTDPHGLGGFTVMEWVLHSTR